MSKVMKREIKFRGKDLRGEGEWIYGYYVGTTNNESAIIPFGKVDYDIGWISDSECHYCNPDTIGQFTGLKDKNGKEIYEGDIIKITEKGGFWLEFIGVVVYCDNTCCFKMETSDKSVYSKGISFKCGMQKMYDGHYTIEWYDEYEVIGNIHDNPELLTEK